MSSTLGERIEEARQKKKMSQGDIARKIGLSRGAIGQWISDTTSPSIERIKELAEMLGVSPAWLAFGQGTQDSVATAAKTPKSEAPEGMLTVPEVEFSSLRVEPKTIHPWSVPEEFVAMHLRGHVKDIVVVEVMDDMMSPTLTPGDRIFIDRSKTKPYPPGIFAFWNGISTTIRRLEPSTLPSADGRVSISVSADNKSYAEHDTMSDIESIQPYIHGRVIGVCRKT